MNSIHLWYIWIDVAVAGTTNQASGARQFDIDLSNPIHVNMDVDEENYPQKYFRKNDYDYANYA